MAVSTTTTEVQSRSYRGLEGILLGVPVLMALVGIGFAVAVGPLASAGGVAVIVLFGMILGGVLALVVPALLYFDARQLQEHELDWKPNPILYVVLGFLFTGLTLLHYLYKRQTVISDREDRSRWWLVAVAGVLLPVIAFVVGDALGAPLGFALLPFGVLLPIGVYKDATYVRLHAEDWHPNPTMHLTLAIFSPIFVVTVPLYLGYYLYKRHTAIGTP